MTATLAWGCVAAVMAGGCAAAPDATPTWIAMPAQTSIHAVWGGADDDAWLVGERGGECVIARWNGVRATEVEHPPCGPALSVRGTSGRDVWITTGGRDRALQLMHWDGVAWSIRWSEPAPARTLRVITVVSEGDLWFGGGDARSSALTAGNDNPWLLHWNGASWEESPALRLAANGSIGTSVSTLIARSNGELWMSTTTAAHWRHAPGAPLDRWETTREPTPLIAAGLLLGAEDGGVWSVRDAVHRWDDGSGSFVAESGFGALPGAMTAGIALDRDRAWYSTVLAVGPVRCTTSGSAFSGIGTSCAPSQRLPAIARWNGAQWSTTTLPESYENARVAWREPTSGALWVRSMGKVGRLAPEQIR